jgi:DNA-binding IclR family transcriptional regulator
MPRNNGSRLRNRTAAAAALPAVKSISRAGNVLACLDAGFGTITEIAEHCRLSKSTVHRLLKALEETQLVFQNPLNHRYYLGSLLLRFALNPRCTHDLLVATAADEMRRLAETCGETVTLVVLSGIRFIQLHEIQSANPLRVTQAGPPVRSLFMGATSRVLLGQLSPAELRIVLYNVDFPRITPATLTDKDIIRTRLEAVVHQGYDTSYGEAIPGAMAIAVPVYHYVLPATLSLAGPEQRLEPRRDEVIREMRAAADRLSRSLALRFAPPATPAPAGRSTIREEVL